VEIGDRLDRFTRRAGLLVNVHLLNYSAACVPSKA
jgi:hypothetical protein